MALPTCILASPSGNIVNPTCMTDWLKVRVLIQNKMSPANPVNNLIWIKYMNRLWKTKPAAFAKQVAAMYATAS